MALVLDGVVDMASAPQFADEVGAALRQRPEVLILDLTGVSFLATAGMGILMEAHRKCAERSLSCRVVAQGSITLRPMQLLGIDDLLHVYPSLDQALRGTEGPAEPF